jgi:cytochrome c peroxidase
VFAAMLSSGESPARGTTLSPEALREIAQVEAEIDRIEALALERLAAPLDNQVQQIELLGKLMLYDKELSVNRNEACAFCHMLETGFTGPVSELNRTTGSYPGSVCTRFSERKPQSHAYAPLAPILHYNPVRATSSAAISGTCVRPAVDWAIPPASRHRGRRQTPWKWVYPISLVRFTGHRSGRIARCSKRSGGDRRSQSHGPLTRSRSAISRAHHPRATRCISRNSIGRAAATFDQMAQSIAGYEASAEVTTFTSKFDAVQAGKAQFTQQEQAGYDLFRGKAQCNACHRDGGPGEDPLFTDFTASNIGTPANPQLPYYAEQRPDARGYVANPEGSSFVDLGVGGFLAKGHPLSQPSSVDARWLPLARDNQARFQGPTLRNVDKRPYPTFVKAYGHNGYFKSLKSIVHFYNTRDVLARCRPNDPGEGITCWPAPESTDNMNTKRVGRLGLSDEEENALVSFMQTLTDGFMQRDQR